MYALRRAFGSKFNRHGRVCWLSADAQNPSKPTMPTDLVKTTDKSTAEIYKEPTKESLQWRTPWHQREAGYYSTLRTFYKEDSNVSYLKFISQPIDFRPSTVKRWWARQKEMHAIANQSYIPERNQVLGNELAAAHFLLFRGGAVKFFGEDTWIKANKLNDYNLPNTYQEDKILQAIDCTDVPLYYESLLNFRDLRHTEWLSLNGCEFIDDWGLDRISNQFKHSLLYLDLRNMSSITHRGLGALYKMDHLKILYVSDIFASREFEMTCLMLQEIKPDLDIHIE